MVPTWLDHALTVLCIAALPGYAAWGYRTFRRKVLAGEAQARVTEYRSTVLIQWSLLVGLLGIWVIEQRPWGELGLAAGQPVPAAITWAVVAALIGFLEWQRRSVAASEESMRQVFAALQSIRELIPRSRAERRWGVVVSVTAGVCEELLYRSFLIAYLSAYMHPWVAVAAAAAAFGAAHAYQGWAGILKTGSIGLVSGVLYQWCDSIAPLIVLHALLDVIQLRMASAVLDWHEGLQETQDSGTSAASEPATGRERDSTPS